MAKKKELPKENLMTLYLEEKKTCDEIAELYETTPNTVKARLSDYGIPVRSRSEARVISLERGLAFTRKGCLPWNRGVPRTPEERAKMSEGQKARYASGAVHPNRGKHLSQSTREKISKANTGKQLGEENPFYGKHHDQETLELLSRQRIEWHENNPGALTGENNPMYGNEEAGKKISEAAKARWQNPEWREQQLAIRETCKEKLSASAKLSWGDPENHERRMRSFLEKFPMTETEQNLDCLLKMHNLPFEYVGNGKLIVNFLCPDFAHHDKPLLIEISKAKYRSGRHLPSWRAEKYAAFGYKVLFLMGEDITGNNWEDICLAKIRDFIAAVNS